MNISTDHVAVMHTAVKKTAAFAEKAAPEAFKWLGWSAAIAVLEVVQRKTGASELRAVSVLLFFLIIGRIQWSLGFYKLQPQLKNDGSWERHSVRRKALIFVLALLCWGLSATIAFYIPLRIAQSDLIEKK